MMKNSDRVLYLAIPDEVFYRLAKKKVIRRTIQFFGVKILLYNVSTKNTFPIGAVHRQATGASTLQRKAQNGPQNTQHQQIPDAGGKKTRTPSIGQRTIRLLFCPTPML